MWFYLFGRSEKYPDPSSEIKSLADLDRMGDRVYLKLSTRNDAPLKNAEEGDTVFLCTREHGRWLVHGDAVMVGAPTRGETPKSMSSVYGTTGRRNWWRRLRQVSIYPRPKGERDLGLAAGTLPAEGQAHVVHVQGAGNGAQTRSGPDSAPSPLASLTQVMDEAWEAGRLTPEEIDEAIRRHREVHPYDR